MIYKDLFGDLLETFNKSEEEGGVPLSKVDGLNSDQVLEMVKNWGDGYFTSHIRDKKSTLRMVFFDEADALFAKRTEVNQSNDKYSNSETAYLLQKIEEYDGMSILATNYYNNFDQAFVRRVTFSVHMESPNAAQRYSLWTGILPAETPVDKEIDFNFLAEKFELSGSNIKAILYSAAYMAGAEGASIGPKHIAKAMQMEFKKLGMLIDAGSFGMFEIYIR